MIRRLALGVLLLLGACGPTEEERVRGEKAEIAARVTRLSRRMATRMATADENSPLLRWVLPVELREISGIVLVRDSSVLAHADERGHVAEINFRTGVMVKRFDLGERTVSGDFEGITRVGANIFMMTSKAVIFRFGEVADKGHAGFEKIDTGLAKECEFEGIAHDSVLNALLLPCKFPRKALRDSLVIFRIPLDGAGGQSRLTVPIDDVVAENDWKTFSPSDITIDPFTGNYVLVSARENGLVVVTPDGEVVMSRPLPANLTHVEGIAITMDRLLLLSAEAGAAPPTITAFPWYP